MRFSRILSRLKLGGPSDDDRSSNGPPLTSASDYHQLTSKRWRRGAVDAEAGGADVFRKGVSRTGMGSVLADGVAGASPACGACARINFARLLDWQPGDARPWISLAHTFNSESGSVGRQKGHEKTHVKRREKKHDKGSNEEYESDERTERNGRGGGGDGSSSPARASAESESESELESESQGPCPWCTFFQAMISTAAEVDEEVQGKKDGSIRSKFTPYLRIRLAFERLGGGEKHQLSKSTLFEVTTRNRSLPWGYIVKASTAPEAADDREDVHDSRPATIRGRRIEPFLDPALPLSWMNFCKEHHGATPCNVKAKIIIPGLKLVDCKERRIVLAESLGWSSYDYLTDVEYATLSYVRGSGGEDEDVDEDDASRTKNADSLPDQLPPLIADAITITQSLGLRYLWVDRYCIPSKRDAARDPSQASIRASHMELMCRVYSQSALTLIVAAGRGIQDGIPGLSVRREEQLSLKTENNLFTTTLLRPDLEVVSSSWASIAWTYQEGLVSQRRLIFTPSQTYFQCQTLHCPESIAFPLHLATGLNFGRVFPPTDDVFELPRLKHHIKSFMAKKLAHDEDRFDAFRGMLYEYAHRGQLEVDHLLGLPLYHYNSFANVKIVSQTDRLAVALGWMPSAAVPARHDDLEGQIIDPYYLVDSATPPFPSWTWLSWRLQTGRDCYNSPNYKFNVSLVGDETPLIDGVSAACGMEISIGFADGMVLSWEIDGDAIARKAERIEFLRLKTLCFSLTVKKPADENSTLAFALSEPAASILGKAAANTIEAWIRRCSVTVIRATADGAPADQEYQLTGILISGRHWKNLENGQTGLPATGTALICGRRNWEPEGPLVRLGVLSVDFEALVVTSGGTADQGSISVARGDDAGAGEKGKLCFEMHELDVY